MTSYATAVTRAMELDENDFDEDDFKFGFKVPKKCEYKNECRWICDNMIDAFGIAMSSINSAQNYDINDIKKLKGKFLTRLVNTSTDPLPPRFAEPRQLEVAKAGDVDVTFVSGGYVADNEEFESGLVIDDPAMNEDIVIEGEETTAKSYMMWYIAGVAVVALVVVGVFLASKKNGDMDDYKKSELVTSTHT